MRIPFKKLHPSAILPHKNEGDIGWDIHCVEDESFQRVIKPEGYIRYLEPGESYLFSTGLSLAIPSGHAMLFRDRSGLAAKNNIHVLAGVIDSSYRGELKVCLINLGKKGYGIWSGDKIVQAIIHEEVKVTPEWVNELPPTDRGEGGFGSTGR